MIKQQLVAVSDKSICIEQWLGDCAWRIYYQKVGGQWVSYRREKAGYVH